MISKNTRPFFSPFLHPTKRLGQNFLRDAEIAKRIVLAGEIKLNDIVMEPGAGYGTLTRLIANQAGRVLAVEKDHRLAERLRVLFLSEPRVEVFEGDVLRLKLPPYRKIVGTPPYNISSKLVLLLASREFELAALVFQEEFGRRLYARPGSAEYGRLSVMAQHSLLTERVLHVPRHAFYPRPKVESVLLKIRPLENRGDYSGLFEWIVREAFTQRRRLLNGSLKHALEKKIGNAGAYRIVNRLNLPSVRVYQVSPGEFMEYANKLEQSLKLEGVSKSQIGLDHMST